MHFFLLILTVFLVRVHFLYTFFTLFYYFSNFKSVKKVYPYEENAFFFFLILIVFLVRVHFFYSFEIGKKRVSGKKEWKNSVKKVYPEKK